MDRKIESGAENSCKNKLEIYQIANLKFVSFFLLKTPLFLPIYRQNIPLFTVQATDS